MFKTLGNCVFGTCKDREEKTQVFGFVLYLLQVELYTGERWLTKLSQAFEHTFTANILHCRQHVL